MEAGGRNSRKIGASPLVFALCDVYNSGNRKKRQRDRWKIEDERGLTMNRTCVAIYLPTDEKENYHGKPLILQNVMFCPVLTWCTRAWAARGVQRFFLVGECSEAILSCFPEGADIRQGTEADWRAHAKELMDEGWRIEESKEPVMPLGNLMISFHSMTELNQLQVACHDSVITQLQSRGVRVMDPNTAYIDPRVEVGEGTIILPNTILRGETVIGRDCEILVLDCPTRGVDIGVKAAMYQLIYQMKKAGKTIIMISEELPELLGMSDRLLILKDGVASGEFSRSEDLDENTIIEVMI